jgi:conjugal transfer pilus assembly protein TraW
MKKILLALLFSLFSEIAVAKDYGIHGKTYDIREKDFLQEIQEKLQEAQKNGKLAKFQDDVKKQMVGAVNSPKAVDGITKATVAREWFFDPSISRPEDLRDQKGQIFYHANTKVNPLDYVSLSKILIFIDGADEAQVHWALAQNKIRKSRAKIILVKGKIIDLMRAKKVRLYFDQNGILTKKFGITAVPATVEQEGKMLKIREIVL